MRLLQVQRKVSLVLISAVRIDFTRMEVACNRLEQLFVLVRLILIFVLDVFLFEIYILVAEVVVRRVTIVAKVHIKWLTILEIFLGLLGCIQDLFGLVERARLRAQQAIQAAQEITRRCGSTELGLISLRHLSLEHLRQSHALRTLRLRCHHVTVAVLVRLGRLLGVGSANTCAFSLAAGGLLPFVLGSG